MINYNIWFNIVILNVRVPAILLLALSIGMVANAYAHTMEVVGDYKIEVGWENEPPVKGLDNAITLEIGIASDYDKAQAEAEDMAMEGMDNMTNHENDSQMTDMTHDGHDHEEEHDMSIELGLLDNFQASVNLREKEIPLKLIEDSQFPGVYHAEFTPSIEGFPMVHIVGTLAGEDVDITFHPEKVEGLSALPPLKQVKEGISPKNVECKTEYVLLLKISDNQPACVSPTSAQKLVEMGWGIKA